MSTHPGLNRLSRDEVCDKYLTLYDNHEDLKKTARLQEERIKRLATKVLRLADDKKKLQKNSSGIPRNPTTSDLDTDQMNDELNFKNSKLENENRNLVKKVDEYKQLYIELLNKNKIVTSRVDSGLFPSAGPNRTSSRTVPRRNSSLRKVESMTPKVTASRSQTMDINHHLVAAQQENQNMLEAITLLQRKLAECQAEKHQMKVHLDHKSEMLNYTNENRALQSSDMMSELSKVRQNLNKTEQTKQSIIMQLDSERSRVQLLQQQLDAASLAHKTTLNELDGAQQMVSNEMEKVAKLQGDRRSLLALKEEIQLEKESRKDMETERDMIKEQLARVIRADAAGTNIWKERETQFQRQIELMEQSIGSDAKEAQRLRIDLHQEKLINKRLSLKLDEMESSLVSFQKSNAILNSIDLNEQNPEIPKRSPEIPKEDPLKVTTGHSGNTNEELEIALRQSSRRVKDLEDKLITCHRQLKSKDKALRGLQEEYDSSRSNLLKTAETQAKTIDEQNNQISTLQRNLKQIGIDGQVPDLAHLTSSKLLSESSSKQVPLGENIVVLNLRQCELFTQESSPSIFCLIEFFNFKPVSTNVVSGFLTDFNFKHAFNVEVTNEFLSVLSSGFIFVELFRVIAGTQHELLGRGRIPLRKFCEKQKFSGKVDIMGQAPGGATVSAIDFDLAAEIPFENAANLHMAKMTAAGYIGENDDVHPAENELEISIFSGSNLESQFEDEKPSSFCTYSFYTYDPCTTSVISSSTDPKFNYTKTHRVEENDNLHRHLTTDEITFVVVDTNDQDDDAEDYLGKCEISLISLADNGVISGSFPLLDPDGAESGALHVEMRWTKPYRQRHGPIAPVPVAKAALPESPPVPAPRGTRPQGNSKKLLDSYLQKTGDVGEPVKVEATVHQPEPPKEEIPKRKSPEPIEEESDIEESILEEPEVEEALDNTSETSPVPVPVLQDSIEPDSLMDPVEDAIAETQSIPESTKTATSVQTNTSMRFTAVKSGESESEVVTPRSAVETLENKEIPPIIIHIKQLEGVEKDKYGSMSVFIEYEFCGCFCETHESLPFPKEEPTFFGFNQKFTFKHGSEKYDHLYSMLLPHDQVSSIIRFTLAADPGDTDDQDCEDLGVADVDLKRFIDNEDFRDEEIEIKNGDDTVAIMTIDIHAADAVKSIMNELTG